MTQNPLSDQNLSIRKQFITRLEELCSRKELVEVIVHDREITGHITEVGEDFIGVSFSIEREITKQMPKDGGGFEPEIQIVVMHLETFFRYTDIDTISRIRSQAVK